jgi:hypothetical protein
LGSRNRCRNNEAPNAQVTVVTQHTKTVRSVCLVSTKSLDTQQGILGNDRCLQCVPTTARGRASILLRGEATNRKPRRRAWLRSPLFHSRLRWDAQVYRNHPGCICSPLPTLLLYTPDTNCTSCPKPCSCTVLSSLSSVSRCRHISCAIIIDLHAMESVILLVRPYRFHRYYWTTAVFIVLMLLVPDRPWSPDGRSLLCNPSIYGYRHFDGMSRIGCTHRP